MPHILTVCTGNICRSPAAEALLREYLGDVASLASAGTHALVGHGIPEPMLAHLSAVGIDATGHEAQLMTPALAASSDVIIAMAAEHRLAIVRQTPAALGRTYLLDELAQAASDAVPLAGGSGAERIGSLGAAISAYRPVLADRGVRDVPDPYGRGQAAYDESFAMIAAQTRAIADWIRG